MRWNIKMTKMNAIASKNDFVFERHDDIGAAGAEDDTIFLQECFVDNGDIEVVLDCNNPKRLLVGRTGAGKTALISEVNSRSKNVIQLSPHSLSLNYIANNSIISFFEALGVNLSAFYGLLWKHIFVVELLRKKFNIKDENSQKNYSRYIKNILYKKNTSKEQAVDYLEKWGNKFWLTTEERMKELTTKIEQSLSATLKAKIPGFDASTQGAQNLSTEERKVVVEHGQRAVSEVQVRELENIIVVLSEDIFNDAQQNYYITIDMLDEEWVDDRIKFKLIKSLIDTLRRFRKVNNVKVIVALRYDLLDKVLHLGSEAGFQEDKYESLYLYLRWNKKALSELIEKRINYLFKRKYGSDNIRLSEVFPDNIGKENSIDYMINRTFLRPRDMILFFNECISNANGEHKLTPTIIKKSEEQYSCKRLQSLVTEWLGVYPNLLCVAKMFDGMNSFLKVSEITKEFLEEKYTENIDRIRDVTSDPITTQIDKLYTGDGNFNAVRNNIIRELHLVGLFGVKTGPSSTMNWSYSSGMSLSSGEVRPSSIIHIHPMFHRALNIRVKNNSNH